MAWLLVDYFATACDIDSIRSQRNAPDRWVGVPVDDRGVLELKQTIVDKRIDGIDKAHHVIESYLQVNHMTILFLFVYYSILFTSCPYFVYCVFVYFVYSSIQSLAAILQ